MKKVIIISGLLGLLIIGGLWFKGYYFNHDRIQKKKTDTWNKRINEFQNDLQSGDLIFQTSLSSQSKAIQIATKSKYSHCGLIFKKGEKLYVFEAVQPVKLTPLDKWIARGKDGEFVIKRLKNADEVLTPSVLTKMGKVGNQFLGKNYDLTFEWSDDNIYCSELIWKIYHRASGLEIGKLQTLREFDLSAKAVQAKMKERYGDKIPLDETVISPASIFDSKLLTTIKTNE